MPILTTLGAACAKAWGFTSGLVKDQYFNLVSLLLPGNGTNGANNNFFLDSSSNNFTITRNPTSGPNAPTQGTFSPFSQTGWGNYFDGTANGSLRADSTTDTNLSGDFTIQAWVYPTANGQSSGTEIISRGAATTSNGWHFGLLPSTTQLYFGLNYGGTGASVYTQSSTNIPLNQWTHVAVTRSGNTCRIYINGVVDTTNTGFTGTPTVSGTEYVYVGRGSYDTSNRQFAGYINNASIIKGTALTTFSQTQPLATGTSGQALLTCTANRFIDTNTATTAKTLTAGSGASVVAFSPFAPTAAYTTAAVGGSGYFDGTGDYLNTPSSASLGVSNGNFTLEFWVYQPGTRISLYPILFASSTGFVANNWSVQVDRTDSAGKVTFFAYNVNTTSAVLTSNATLAQNSFYHIAFVRNGATLSLYINGTLDNTANVSTTALDSGTTAYYIGSQNAVNTYFYGYISGLRLLVGSASAPSSIPTSPPTAIANTQLLLNFTNAGITDATAKNDLETVGNAQISTSVSKFPGGGSIAFDGTSDYLYRPDTALNQLGTGDYTIELWVYPNSFSNTPVLLEYGRQAAGSTPGLELFVATTSGRLDVYGGSAANTLLFSTTSTNIATGTWTHIALTRASGTTRLYFNGTQPTGSSVSDTTNYTQANIWIGAYIGGTASLNGYIDDFRITRGLARYTTTSFTPPSAPFPVQ